MQPLAGARAAFPALLRTTPAALLLTVEYPGLLFGEVPRINFQCDAQDYWTVSAHNYSSGKCPGLLYTAVPMITIHRSVHITVQCSAQKYYTVKCPEF